MQPSRQRRHRFRSAAACIAAAVMLSACGGGGGGNRSVPGGPTAPSPGGGASSANRAPATVSVSFLQYQPINASSSTRRAAFISPATASIGVSITQANGVTLATPLTTVFNVGASQPNCTANGAQVTCSATIDAPVGSDVVTVASYPQANGGGTPLGTSTVPVSVAQNATNVIPLAIGGTIANLKIVLTQASFTLGTAATSYIIVVPIDASGAVIVNPGNYNPAIAVALTGGAGAFGMKLDGASTATTSATLASPNDQLILAYDGSGSTTIAPVLTATAGTAFATTSALASSGAPALTVTPTGTGAVGAAPDQFVFPLIAQSGTLAVAGGVPPYTATTGNASIATVSGSSPAFTITAAGAGSTTITVKDSTTATVTVPVTVQTPPITATPTCGSFATCTQNAGTQPQIVFPPAYTGGPNGNATASIALSGGTGTYSYYFASTGTSTGSPYVTASAPGSGTPITLTPGATSGSDSLIITSGSQSLLYNVVVQPAYAAIPATLGLGGPAPNYGGAQAIALPNAAASASIVSASPANAISTSSIASNSITITPHVPGNGVIAFLSSSNQPLTLVPFTVFGLAFSTYGQSNGASATEAFFGTGETDTVTVSGLAGGLGASSGNTGIVSVSSVVGNRFSVTANAPGTTTITLTDAGTGASFAYTVSVTTTTIPIAGRARAK